MKCHICGSEADYECRDCGKFVCDNCTVPYTQFNQVDYTLCKMCGDAQENSRANEYFRQEQQEKQELKDRQIKNKKQREYYHSEKPTEKRRLKKVELQKLKVQQKEEREEMLSHIFRNIFKHL